LADLEKMHKEIWLILEMKCWLQCSHFPETFCFSQETSAVGHAARYLFPLATF